MKVVCQNCGHVDLPSRKQRGHTLITIILLFFWIIPGIIYYIWRSTDRSLRCDRCHSINVIPMDTEAARMYVRPDVNVNSTDSRSRGVERSSVSFKLGKLWASSPKPAKVVVVVIAFTFFAFLFIPESENLNTKPPRSSDSTRGASTHYDQEIEACEKRGVAYFSEIGSYPYLSDGRKAAEVARDRCTRTLTAF